MIKLVKNLRLIMQRTVAKESVFLACCSARWFLHYPWKPQMSFHQSITSSPCGSECCHTSRLTLWLNTFISDAHVVMGHNTEHRITMWRKKIPLAQNVSFVKHQWLHLIILLLTFPTARRQWRVGNNERAPDGAFSFSSPNGWHRHHYAFSQVVDSWRKLLFFSMHYRQLSRK